MDWFSRSFEHEIYWSGNDYQLKEDEHLAKALQESLKLAPPSSNRNGNAYRPIQFPNATGFRRCAGCNQSADHGRLLTVMGAVWHPECFRCQACNLPIANHEVSFSGNSAYHKSCYKEKHHPRCDVCNNFMRTNGAGLVEYKVHPFWAQKYCVFHDRDGTPRCCSCDRLEPKGTRYVALGDGRKLCLECLESAIMDTTECQPLYLDIQKFYEGLNMKMEKKIPLLLVERQALNEAMNGETNSHYHLRETRGLCLSEEQTISTVSRQTRIGIGNWVPHMRTEPYELTRVSEVTAILILHGLPRLLTGTILAHEMMHAWLRLNGYPAFRPDVEEGICQVVAYMWLTSQKASISGQTTTTKKLLEFVKYQIESEKSQAYGNGFRAGNRAVLKHGLQKTLYHMRLTGSFPF